MNDVPTPQPIVALKCSREWRDWLQRFAAEQRTTASGLVDQALAQLARDRGFPAPPPRLGKESKP